jgi:hypothetical protein
MAIAHMTLWVRWAKKARYQDVRVCPCGKTKKNIVIFHCWKCTTRHCQSVLILWHLDCSLDYFNFTLRFTLKNLHFLDQLKASFSSNICPDCISCHLEYQNFLDPPPNQEGANPPLELKPVACPVSSYFQKFSIYLKTFWEPYIIVISSFTRWHSFEWWSLMDHTR